MGAVGLAVAAIAFLVIREPPRARSEMARGAAQTPDFKEVLRIAWQSKPFVLLVIGGALMAASYASILTWLPTFLNRVHGLGAQDTGAYLGIYRGFVGTFASLGGGILVTLLSRLDERWLAWRPAIRYSLLVSPVAMTLGSLVLFVLANAIQPGSDGGEAGPAPWWPGFSAWPS